MALVLVLGVWVLPLVLWVLPLVLVLRVLLLVLRVLPLVLLRGWWLRKESGTTSSAVLNINTERVMEEATVGSTTVLNEEQQRSAVKYDEASLT
jgi:hypothetical protein